jgi:hypothetical protein
VEKGEVVESLQILPNATQKKGNYYIKIKVDGVVRAWTRLHMDATWYPSILCVKINSATASHWTAEGWGKWIWGDKKLGSGGCALSHNRWANDTWDAPSGYPDKYTYIFSHVYYADVGDFNWLGKVW